MDWFEKLTGFRELSYQDTHGKLEVRGKRLHSLVNGASYEIGELELVSLLDLRRRAGSVDGSEQRIKVSVVSGDVRRMHHSPANAGALFQVASQFNLLEMVSPNVTPEEGVTRYQSDHTQGPACAIAAGAATIFRNYFAPVDGEFGQTASRQIDGLEALGEALCKSLATPVADLWWMTNGYALASVTGLEKISGYLKSLPEKQIDALREKLCIGLHWDVEVTDASGDNRPRVSQAFCSALPVAYSRVPAGLWQSFATLILEAAYEATMWAAVLNARRGASSIIFLTLLGGGAFGNDDAWIYGALTRALKKVCNAELDVRLVSYGQPPQDMLEVVEAFVSPI